jgi:flagellar biosynthesis/type III secretory pathway chaperone
MDRFIEQLIAVLQQTETLYERMLPLIEQEKEAALGPDATRLTGINAEKQSLIAQLAQLEKQRTRLSQGIAEALRLPLEKVNLTALAANVTAPYDRQLRQLHDRLRGVVEKVRQANEQCRVLIEYCLRLVQKRLGFFQYWMGRVDVYGASGSLNNGPGGGGRLLSGTV